jgi:hypothetical protein
MIVSGSVVRTGAVALLVSALVGCGGDVRSAAVGRVAADFGSAVAADDGAAACALLSPATAEKLAEDAATECADAVLEADLPDAGEVRSVDVYGGQARVVLDGDTMFVAELSDGWAVVAAGCRPRGERPYDCELEGG